MRTGEMWAITKHGIEPDIIVTGKGLSGGMYPITAAMLSDRAAQWLDQDGFAHISTFGGAELGCVAGIKTLEITSRPEVRSMVHYIAEVFADGLRRIQSDYPDWFIGIRQNGVVIGLEFDHPEGAKFVMRELYENGVWAIFSTLDPRVLQFKPGILLGRDLCEDVLDRLDVAVRPCPQGCDRTEAAHDDHRSSRPPARARQVGGPRLRRLRPGRSLGDRRRGGRRGVRRGRTVRRSRRHRDRDGRRRAQGRSRTGRARGASSTTIAARISCRRASTPSRKIVEIPRPAGVVLAITPTTNPVSTVYFKVILVPDDAQCRCGGPASACQAMLGRRRAGAGRSRRRRRGARRHRPGDRRAVDTAWSRR